MMCSLSIFPQNTTVTIKSNPLSSKNATLVSSNPSENYGNFPEFIASNSDLGATRSLIYFNITSIPSDATIITATLKLYSIPSSTNGHYGANTAVIQRVATSWDENSVNWSNIPAASTTNQVFTTATVSSNENAIINVKPLIENMILNSTNNQGFLFRLTDETGNKSAVYGSPTYADTTKRPELVITYSLPQTTCVNIYMDNVHGSNVNICGLPQLANSSLFGPGGTDMLKAEAWTASGAPMTTRALMEFYVSNEIPTNAIINSANLYLFSDTVDSFHFHSQLSGPNDAYLKRVDDNFDMTTVTWNTAPTAYSTNSVFLPASTSDTQHYIVNVTQLLNDSRTNSDTKFALLFGLNNENYYRKLQFLPGNTIYIDKRPYLKVCYSLPDKLADNETTKSADFSINPNPSNGILNIFFKAPFGGSLSVYDQLGKIVFQTTMNQESSKTIDLSAYYNANYIVKTIAKDGTTSTKKITILR